MPFLSLRCVVPALLTVAFLIAASESRAGTYVWQTKDANNKIIAQSPAFTGGTAVGLSYNSQGTPIYSAPYPPTTSTYGGGGGEIDKPSCNGTISATFTWQADPTKQTDPPPPAGSVIVMETCTARASALAPANASCSAQCDDGMGQPGSTQSVAGTPSYYNTAKPPQVTQYTASVSTTDTRYSVGGGSSIPLTLSPSASAAASAPNYGGGWNTGASVSYSVTASPITLSLTGTLKDASGKPVLDGSGNQQILVGQGCTAGIVGIPSGTGWKTTYQWSVSGTTFQDWEPAGPTGGIIDFSQRSFFVGGPGPLTNATASWYWNDPLISPATATETVSCTATVTPPAGQGAAFPVTATQKVTVYVPSWTATGTGGYMQVNTNCDGHKGTICLYAGPFAGTGKLGGMNFSLTVYSPTTPAFGNGTIEMVQTITPNYTYVTNTNPPQNHAFPQNNLTGLDGACPYNNFSTPETNEDDPMDSPNLPLAGTTTATVQGSFKDYLMYQPPNSSQFVPLATFTWSVNGTASSPTGNWAAYKGPTGTDAVGGTVSDPNTSTPFAADKGGTDFPSWTQIIKAVPF